MCSTGRKRDDNIPHVPRALPEKQLPETVTGFKLAEAYHPGCMAFWSVVVSLTKTKKALVCMCGFVAEKSALVIL